MGSSWKAMADDNRRQVLLLLTAVFSLEIFCSSQTGAAYRRERGLL